MGGPGKGDRRKGGSAMRNWQERARRMVDSQIRARGILDERVMAAMERVPRTAFVPEELQEMADCDGPLPIGQGQTVSQPFMVALMTELLVLPEGARVLEIGTGSGYQAALLAEMGMEVVSIERIASLATTARERLSRLGYPVLVIHGDGRLGYPPKAPFGGILVTAAAPALQRAWLEQMEEGANLVVPLVVEPGLERLLVRKRTASGFRDSWSEYCRFVPLLPDLEEEAPGESNPSGTEPTS